MEDTDQKEMNNEEGNEMHRRSEEDMREGGVRPKHWWRDSIVLLVGSVLCFASVAIAIEIAFMWIQPQTIVGKLLSLLVPIGVGSVLFNILFLGRPASTDRYKNNTDSNIDV